MDWAKYPSFSRDELKCKHTGECNMHPDMMRILQSIRDELERPIFISSGYRSVKHPVEQEKDKPGEHTYGMAVDILCHGERAIKILELAINHGIRRIGVHQKGNANGRFIHIGIADRFMLEFPAALWTY
ncbi:TPA: peptidase M15 [Legionella pneumophila]|nr:peptidase M15 [Legionella pneumophila]HAT5922965.1 peptidase M15 [Legionella pneumophila]HAT5934491.1 peptidase M15 [Legionella pneumophila]HAT5950243.1 peptidase M15 [Legionella pneumophila]HAT5962128.1 peptidase M15 [Legionella pneumophila]